MKKLNKSKGVVFWITGLPGSGKTLLANLIQDEINSIYGKSIVVSGDDLRNIFNLRISNQINRCCTQYVIF